VIGRRLRLIWLALGLSSCLALIVLFLLPTGWEVERRADLEAPPEQIFPWLEDLGRWEAWSPWQEGSYEGLEFHYPGAMAGAGAEMRWDSPGTGDGVLRIVESEPPRRLVFEMAFQRGRITTRDTLTLEPLPGGLTRVTWHDQGSLGRTLTGRLSIPLVERSMGHDMEIGLARLAEAVAAERASGSRSP
jgi:uncharacterized protein YndB with AHSA1/START domain